MTQRTKTRKLTKEKRKTQQCKVYQLKLDKSKLSKSDIKHLHMIFIEGKWLYNHVLSHKNVLDCNTKIKKVPVKVGEETELRSLKCISSQMKQSIRDRVFSGILALSALKKKGNRVGRLKFKSNLNSVPLKQFNTTYKINRATNTVKLQGLKHKLKVRGLNQIPLDSEIANATLTRKNGDFYIHVTTFRDKEELLVPNTSIGIDFGCETQLVLSNGIKIEYQVPISKRVRKLDRKIMRKNRKKSNNKRRDQVKRAKAYQKLTNKKRDIKNKIVHHLVTNYKYVCFQDESIHAWHAGNHGKKIQNTAIGGIISALKHKARTPIMVDKFYPSTQLCPDCGHKYKLQIYERTYSCPECGYTNDRDIKSAIMIEREGLKGIVPTERREVKPEDSDSSTRIITDMFDSISGVRARVAG